MGGVVTGGVEAVGGRDEGVHGRRWGFAVVIKPGDELVAFWRREAGGLVDDGLESASRTRLLPGIFGGGGVGLGRLPGRSMAVHGQLAILPCQLRHFVVKSRKQNYK